MICAIVFAFIGAMVFVLMIWYWDDYVDFCGASCKIKFADFLKWYAIDQESWEYYAKANYVCHKDRETRHMIGCRFGYFDFIRYQKWVRQKIRQRKRRAECSSMEVLLRSVQNDIDRLREESRRELSEAEAVTRRVMENPTPESPVEDFLKVWRNIKIH